MGVLSSEPCFPFNTGGNLIHKLFFFFEWQQLLTQKSALSYAHDTTVRVLQFYSLLFAHIYWLPWFLSRICKTKPDLGLNLATAIDLPDIPSPKCYEIWPDTFLELLPACKSSLQVKSAYTRKVILLVSMLLVQQFAGILSTHCLPQKKKIYSPR